MNSSTLHMSFKSIIHEPVEGNKHVPFIKVEGNKICVRCGKDELHPMTATHYIGWIKLYGMKKNILTEIGTTQFWPEMSQPVTMFEVPDITAFTKLVATSYCNMHGIYENSVDLQ